MGLMGEVAYTCQYCGRKWVARTKAPGSHTGWTGFLSSNVNTHKVKCAWRTPAERRQAAIADGQRWGKRPPKHTVVTDDLNHPGMKG